MVANITPVIQIGFAAGGGKNTIGVPSSATPGRASYTDGFPPLTRTPIASGGIPPSGLDMNGILFDISNAIAAITKGGTFAYDATYAAAIGGYQVGARLARSDGMGIWLNLTANNTTDPEGGSPSGWVGVDSYGSASIAVSNANVALSNVQAAHGIIYVTGTLTANVLLTFPAWIAQWAVYNLTSGAFTLTAEAAGGTSVITLPQSAPTLLIGNGTDVADLLSTYTRASDPLNVLAGHQVFSTPGTFTYTPSAGTKQVVVEVVGGGGGGGSAAAASGSTTWTMGSPGGGGGYGNKRITSGFSGVTITVGAGGAGGTVGGTVDGATGGTSSFGSAISATGGLGGSSTGSRPTTDPVHAWGTAPGGTASSADAAVPGKSGEGFALYSTAGVVYAGAGGDSALGKGGVFAPATGRGAAGTGYGGGGSGAAAIAPSFGVNGYAGAAGAVIVWEYK